MPGIDARLSFYSIPETESTYTDCSAHQPRIVPGDMAMHPPEGTCRRLTTDLSASEATGHASSTASGWLPEQIYQGGGHQGDASCQTGTSGSESTVQGDTQWTSSPLNIGAKQARKCPCARPRTLCDQSPSPDGPQASTGGLVSAADSPSVVPKSCDLRASPVLCGLKGSDDVARQLPEVANMMPLPEPWATFAAPALPSCAPV